MDAGEDHEAVDDYDGQLPARFNASSSGRLLRGALLVAAALVVVAMIAVPIADHSTSARFADNGLGIDMMATGSIGNGEDRQYTIRRSVLQAPGAPPCILFANGASRGGC